MVFLRTPVADAEGRPRVAAVAAAELAAAAVSKRAVVLPADVVVAAVVGIPASTSNQQPLVVVVAVGGGVVVVVLPFVHHCRNIPCRLVQIGTSKRQLCQKQSPMDPRVAFKRKTLEGLRRQGCCSERGIYCL